MINIYQIRLRLIFFMKLKINKGFTLTELMVVVSILALLAGIVIPFYASYVTNAKLIKELHA